MLTNNSHQTYPIILILFYVFLQGIPHLTYAQEESKAFNLGFTESFYSSILGEKRKINIYLPQGYCTDDTCTYPVIFIPDGGLKGDFIHLVGLVRYNTKSWIARFPATIVVGIENVDRQRDFTAEVDNLEFLSDMGYTKEDIPSYGGSAKYIAFIKDELQPYIKSKYHGSGNQTIIGESLAGLLITEILLKYPSMFDTYIIISPSLWWGDEELLKKAPDLLKTRLRHKVTVFIGAPNKGENVKMFNEAERLYKLLKKNKRVLAYFKYFPAELHSTVFHKSVYAAFKTIYPETTYSH